MPNRVILVLLLSIAGLALHAQFVGLRPVDFDRLRAEGFRKSPDTSLMVRLVEQRLIADAALKEDPHPIDTIRSEGLLQGNPLKTATQEALRDMPRIYALALSCWLSKSTVYLPQLKRYIMAWATTNHSRGDPIDDTNLDGIIAGYDMTKNMFSPEERATVTAWLKATAEMELSAVYNRPGRATSTNNWHSHRLKIIGEIAFTIGDTALESYTIRALKQQIATNLNPDGSSSDFVTRDALHYHVYDLEPLLTLAIVLKRATGIDYYSWVAPTGTSIKKSVDWLIPYLDGTKTHGEFVNSTVEFDRQRARNGEAAYKAGSLFDPRNGVATLVLASYFEPDSGFLPLARKLSGKEGMYPTWQAVVNGLTRERVK